MSTMRQKRKAENSFSEFAYVLPPVSLHSLSGPGIPSYSRHTTWKQFFAGSRLLCALNNFSCFPFVCVVVRAQKGERRVDNKNRLNIFT